jgi:hypothetical protein
MPKREGTDRTPQKQEKNSMKSTSILQMVIRVIGLLQLILGIAVWTGNADFLIMFHILLGSVLTVALWVLAYQASRAGVSQWLVILAVVWALVLPIWGLAQEHILPEAYNWIAQVLHLLSGVGAVGLAEILAGQMRKKRA